MDSSIIVAILSLVGTLSGSVVGILTANKMVNYRIDQLEHKVDKHNSVVEKVLLLEKDNSAQWKRIDELRNDLEAIKKQVYGRGDK